MADPASPLDLPLHTHLGVVAQCRGGLLRQAHQAAIEARRLPIGRRPASRNQSLRPRPQCRAQALHLDCRSRQNNPGRQTRAPSVRFDPLDRACLLVGRFLYVFAKLEAELDTALAILFKLDQGSANIIVAARSTELLRTVEIVRARDLR